MNGCVYALLVYIRLFVRMFVDISPGYSVINKVGWLSYLSVVSAYVSLP